MKPQSWISGVAISLGALGLLAGASQTQGAARPACALVLRVDGSAEYFAAEKNQWQPLKPGLALPEGLQVRTGAKSTLDLGLTTHALVRLTENSQLRLAELRLETPGLPDQHIIPIPHTRLKLEQGGAFVRTAKLRRPGASFAVETATGIARATGTAFLVWREGNQLCVRVTQDSVAFLVNGQTVTVAEGQQLNLPIDPATGQLAGAVGDPFAAPADDAVAQAFAAFQQGTQGFAASVLGPEPVNLEQLVQALAGAGEGGPGTTPTLVLIGTPGSVTEISPSTP